LAASRECPCCRFNPTIASRKRHHGNSTFIRQIHKARDGNRTFDLRYSTPEQALGDSERRQVERAREWATANGYDYDDTYRDLGISGFRGKNRAVGALKQFLDDVRSGRIPKGDLLLTESFDRLSREPPMTAFRLFDEIIAQDITLVTGFLSGNPQIYSRERLDREPYLLHSVLGEMMRAHSESQWKSERVAEAHERKRRAGRESGTPIAGRTSPAWLELSEHAERCIVNQPRAEIVNRIFTWAASGLGNLQIAKRLNCEGVESFRPEIKGRKTKGWQTGYIQKLLANEAVLGTFQPHRYVDEKQVPDGDPIENFFPPIVSESLYYQAQQAIEGRLRRGRGRIGKGYPNLVKGLGRFAICDGSLGYVDKTPISRCGDRRKYVYLRCTAAAVGSCSNRAGFPYNRLEPMLFRLHDLTEAIAGLIPEQPDDEASRRVAELETVVARKKQHHAALFAEFADHPIGSVRDGARAQIEKLGAEIEQAERQVIEARRHARMVEHADRKGFFARWNEAMATIESADAEERYLSRVKVAQEFRRIIDVVELHDDRRVIVRTKPDRHRWQTEYVLSPQTIESVRVILPNANTAMVAVEVLNGVVLVHPDIPGCDRMSPEQLARQSVRLAAALSNKRIRVDRTPEGNFEAVLIDGPRLNRLPVSQVENSFDEKPAEPVEPATSLLDD
jgi:DNA invertase Pin-like site-specific DNA recombinase